MFTETRVPKDIFQGSCFLSSLPTAINEALSSHGAHNSSSSVLYYHTAEELLILLYYSKCSSDLNEMSIKIGMSMPHF